MQATPALFRFGSNAPLLAEEVRRALRADGRLWVWIDDPDAFSGWLSEHDGLLIERGGHSNLAVVDDDGRAALSEASEAAPLGTVTRVWRSGAILHVDAPIVRAQVGRGRGRGRWISGTLHRAARARWLARQFRRAPSLESVERSEATLYGQAGLQADYVGFVEHGLFDSERRVLEPRFAPGLRFLCIGSGPGRENIAAAEHGMVSVGVDVCEASVRAGNALAQARGGQQLSFVCASMNGVRLEERFDLIYVSPAIYACIPGREARIAALRNLRRHLTARGEIVMLVYPTEGSAWGRLIDQPRAWLRRWRDDVPEPGDRFSQMTPDGPVDSFRHHFRSVEDVTREVEAAGLLAEFEGDETFVLRRPSRVAIPPTVVRKERVLLDTGSGLGFRTNAAGIRGFEALAESGTVEAVRDALAEIAPADRVELDACALVDQLLDRSLVRAC